ncbi:uncharacterized protein [Chlorocebus sabaeus]|uniref:uncharacterized protein n=1 Tax=Chlorocebus sabaeus TaxID=60711 RepID=UPI003BF9EDEA
MMALSQRSQGTRSRLLLKMERQSCVGKMRNCKLVRPKEANNEGAGKEASATRVISQPQMLDKSKEAESLWDDIQKGWSDYLEEKTLPILSKTPTHEEPEKWDFLQVRWIFFCKGTLVILSE